MEKSSIPQNILLISTPIIAILGGYLVGSGTQLVSGTNITHFLGIIPRDFSINNFLSIILSWIPHSSLKHLFGNISALTPLLAFLYLSHRNRTGVVLIGLVLISGIMTWLLGAPGSIHIGASGLIFALFGYLVTSSIFGKSFTYLIFSSAILATYFYSIVNGLIPKDGISFSAHFGGFLGGLALGYFLERNRKIK